MEQLNMFNWENTNFINPLPIPEYDKSKIGHVKSLHEDVEPYVPKYMVTFKKPVDYGYIRKICIYYNGWHSLDGTNYSHKEIEKYEELGVDFDWHTLGTNRWYAPQVLEKLIKQLSPFCCENESDIEKLGNGKIHQILQGLEDGLSYQQVNVYSKGYTSPQMQQLRWCFNEKLSNEQISLIADPNIKWEHMQIMRTGFKAGMSFKEISQYLNPSSNWWHEFQRIQKEAERRTKTMKQRIFFDMDGTLAVFNPTKKLEDLYEQGYFSNLKPYDNMVLLVKRMIEDYPDEYEVFICSSYLSDSNFALEEKNQWLDNYLPEIDEKHRLFLSCGSPKKEIIPGGLKTTDVLIDDYTANLLEWCPPGLAGKVLNDINDTHKTWTGPRINKNDDVDVLVKSLIEISERKDVDFKSNDSEVDEDIPDDVDETFYDPYAGCDSYEDVWID